MICTECRAPIPRSGWTPFNVHGQLFIAWRCPNGHAGQHNRVGYMIAPIGKPPDDLPPLSPIDLLDV